MQLKDLHLSGRCTRIALSAAAAALLAPAASAAERPPVEVDSAVLGYIEPGRVQVLEGVLDLRTELREGHYLHGHLVFDALTGASANGAVPSRSIQTFTRPSGQSRYTTSPGDTPVDNGFSDNRFAANVGYDRPLGRLSRLSLGAQGSFESDYTSVGGQASLTRDFFQRNTTLGVGFAWNRDQVSPLGGIPLAYASMPTVLTSGGEEDEGGGESKNVMGLTAGVTQVLGKNSLVRINYSYDRSSGYLTDPYNMLSVVAPVSAVAPGSVQDVVHESRPSVRAQHAVYTEFKRALGSDVADLSYRFASNDWGTTSHAVELRLRHYLRPTNYVQPHVRYYTQTRSDFYTRYLSEGDPLPLHASADYRLADMKTTTLGAEFGHQIAHGRWATVALEYYRQYDIGGGGDGFGALDGLDLYPEVTAWSARVGVSGEW